MTAVARFHPLKLPREENFLVSSQIFFSEFLLSIMTSGVVEYCILYTVYILRMHIFLKAIQLEIPPSNILTTL